MNQLQNRLLSIGLLFCLGWSIIPAESFHAHDESSVVCQEDQQHFANHSHDCELADFILPHFTEFSQAEAAANYSFSTELLILEFTDKAVSNSFPFRSRGPPSC